MASSLTMESTMANVDNDEGFLQKDDYFADEMMGIVSDLVAKCSTLSLVEGKRMGDIEKRLDVLQDKIVAWDCDPFMIWDCDPEEASEYLNVVNEVRQFSESLESLRSEIMGDEYNELVHRAHSILQMAMARLEKEFVHLLVLYQQTLEPDHMSSFRSTDDYSMGDLSSCSSFEVHPIVGRMQSESSIEMDEFVIDLIHPSSVSDLKCVAEMMLKSNYDKECCKAYISIRKEALYKSFSVLCMERSSTDILQMDSGFFNSMIKRWNQAIKVFIRVCLTNERSLCDLILGGYSPSARNSCFVEITKDVNLKMLNFYGAVSTGSPKPEKLFRMLDMFEGLYNLIPEIDSSVVSECQGVLSRLGEFIRLILTEFKNAIQSYTSTNAFAGGGYHPFTKYAMNYIKTIADYSETLDLLLEDQDDDDLSEESKAILSSVQKSTPVIQYLLSITSMIESNLEGKSILYRDAALQHIFLMNNIFYMVQKVKDSELQKFLGEEWIKEHSKKYRQHAISYQRASWNPVLLFLRDEGIWDQGLYSPLRTVIKDRFKKFNLVFEEVYKSQTAWVIPSVWLRVDLRISVSIVVLQAYRTFVGRYSFHLDNVRQKNKYIKYSLVDLEEFLLDLFEGFPKSLHSLGRKNN